jgi:hypothetical protein
VHRATVVIELEQLGNDALAARDLAAGGLFVPDSVLRLGEECDVVVRGAHHQIWLPARAVYVDERGGAGLELIGFSSEVKAQLAELEPVESRVDEPCEVAADHELGALIDLEALADADDGAHVGEDEHQDDLAIPLAAPDARQREHGDTGVDVAADEADALEDDRPDDPFDDGPPYDRIADDPGEPSTHDRPARNIHERLRGLNLAAQLKLAAAGELHERIVLERLYGKNVWETLLRNPRLTAPEVSRIARYGSLPRVLLEVILANNAWMQVPEVRRAVLSNSRLGTDQIMKILRLMPKHELKLAAIQTVYPQGVRTAAKLVLRGG